MMEKFKVTKEDVETKIASVKVKKGNPYDVEYQMKRFNLSRENAEIKIAGFKEKRGNPYDVEYQMKRFNLTKEEVEEKIKNIKVKTSSNYNLEYVAKRDNLTLEEAEEKIKAIKKLGSESVKNAISKIRSTKEGEQAFRSRSTRCIEHWLKKGYSKEEAKLMVAKAQKVIGDKWAKKNKENPELYLNRTTTQLGYYLAKGMSKEEAKEALSNRQRTFTLEKCIVKYGETEGKRIWQERQTKWQEKWQEKYKKGNFNTHTFEGSQSKIAKKFIDELIKKGNLKNYHCYLNKEYTRTFKEEAKTFAFDFVHKPSKLVIEFNGDFWHGNPKIYEANNIHPFLNKPYKEIWEYDKLKKELIEKYGYKVIYVWESDYIKNPKDEIDKCLKEINGTIYKFDCNI